MPVVAVNVVKVLFALALYGFLFYVARAMRTQVARPASGTAQPATPRRPEPAASPAPPGAVFVIEVADGAGEARTIEVTERIIIGRGGGCDVVIADEYSSDRHAAIEVADGVLWVEDLGSTNGTRIADRRITERTKVARGTEITVGQTRVVVR